MTVELLARLGGVTAAGGLGLLLVASPRGARLAGLGLWAVGMTLFVPLLVPAGQGGVVAAGGLALVALAAALAWLFRRVPWALAFLALAVVPARVPVTAGDESATLLIPLYVVVAGAAVALGWSIWQGEDGGQELGRASWPLALFVTWVGASALWAGDAKEASIDLFFFVLPFTLLALAIARLPLRERPLGWLARLFVAMALIFAAVGIWQWATKEIFWNVKVVRGNENSELFRVNSLFWDPSIYGRFLILAMLIVLVVLVFRRLRLPVPIVVATVAGLWVGLFFSFSQSSFAALLAALAVLAVFAWGRLGALALATVALAGVVAVLVVPALENVRSKFLEPSSASVNRVTQGRFDLVSKGIRIAVDHPLVGVGVGNFTSAYEKRFDAPGRLRTPASHTTPVTIAAETGIVGLGLFVWLVVTALSLAFGSRRAELGAARLTGLVCAFGLVAIVVHSLFYSAFLEDPTAWGLLGLAALAARASVQASEEEAPRMAMARTVAEPRP
jgi:O-antigen ligase